MPRAKTPKAKRRPKPVGHPWRDGPSGEQQAKRAERNVVAFQLRLQGLSYRDIAVEMRGRGYRIQKSQVCKIVNDRLQELADMESESAAGLREVELRRLDTQAAVLWPLAMGDPGDPDHPENPREATPPSLAAHDRLLRIADRRAKLLGLDAPTKLTATDIEGKEAAPLSVTYDLSGLSDGALAELKAAALAAEAQKAEAAAELGPGAPTLH